MDILRKFENLKIDNKECCYDCDGVCSHRKNYTCKCYAAEIVERGEKCLKENMSFDSEIIKYLSEREFVDYIRLYAEK